LAHAVFLFGLLEFGVGAQNVGLVGILPGEALAAEVAIGRRRQVDRSQQVQHLDQPGGLQLEVPAHQFHDLGVRDTAGAEGVDQHGGRLSDADGVGQLYFTLLRDAGGHDVLGNVARQIGGRTVNLGGVLAGEGTATVARVAAVGVDDDLASGQAAVTVGAADHEAAGGVDVELGLLVDPLGRKNLLDDLFHNAFADI